MVWHIAQIGRAVSGYTCRQPAGCQFSWEQGNGRNVIELPSLGALGLYALKRRNRIHGGDMIGTRSKGAFTDRISKPSAFDNIFAGENVITDNLGLHALAALSLIGNISVLGPEVIFNEPPGDLVLLAALDDTLRCPMRSSAGSGQPGTNAEVCPDMAAFFGNNEETHARIDASRRCLRPYRVAHRSP